MNSRVRAVAPALPPSLGGQTLIAAENGSEIYIFDGSGRHLRTVEPLMGAARYVFNYDGTGRLIGVTDASGNTTVVERNATGRPTAVVAPGGQRTDVMTGGEGAVSIVTNPNGAAVHLDYTTGGLLDTLTDARSQEHHFIYDPSGRLVRDEDPAGGQSVLTRSVTPTGYLVAVTSALSRVNTFDVATLLDGVRTRTMTNPSGLQTALRLAANGTRTTSNFDGWTSTLTQSPDPRFGMHAPLAQAYRDAMPSGLMRTISEARMTLTDPSDPLILASATTTWFVNGSTSTSSYDSATHTIIETTPAGRQRVVTFDSLGRIVSMGFGGLAPTTFGRDSTGLIRTIARNAVTEARVTTLDYDSNRRLHSMADAAGRVVTLHYDDADRVIQETLPDGRLVGFGYDANDNVTSITPPGQPPHEFDYTPIDLEARYRPPAIGGAVATSYTFNPDRQLTEIRRPDGEVVQFAYEGTTGRLATRTTSDDVVIFGYNPTYGQLTSLTSTRGEDLEYTYDGSFVSSATWSGVVAGNVTTSHDAFFRVNHATVNGVEAADFNYDVDGLLTHAGSLMLTRHPQNGLVAATQLGSIADSRTYDPFGDLESYTVTPAAGGPPYLETVYSRDALGRISQRVESILGTSHTTVYGYDPRSRLQSARTDGTMMVTYAYDDNGNRVSRETPADELESGTYDSQDRLLSYADASYSYTANGDLATKTSNGQTTVYEYDALGNLRGVQLPSDTLIEYVIDPQNRRVGKKVNGALIQGFLYEDQLRIAAELDGNGDLVSRFVYGTRSNVPDYMVKDGTTYRIVTDDLGSPRLVIDVVSGSVVQRMDYDEFGRVLMDTNPGFQPFGFAGGLYDRDTTLVRFGVRDYDGRTGRWTSKDPARFFGGLNQYEYAGSNPVNLTDVTGNDPMPSGGAYCGSTKDTFGITLPLPSPATGDPSMIQQAYDFASIGAQSGCGVGGPAGGLGPGSLGAGIDWDDPKHPAWFWPSGDDVVDYSRCVHERQHLMDAALYGDAWSKPDYERNAYQVQANFLSGYVPPYLSVNR